MIKSKEFNEWIFSNEDKKNKLISQLTSSIKKEDLEKLFPSFKKAGNKHKRINAAVDSILKNNFIETLQDEGNFEKQVLIENIKYIDYNEIQIIVIAKMINKFNPNSKFTRYLINHTAKLSSYQQIRICELCYQYIGVGLRKMEIQELKNFIGISKNKTTYKLIQELKACITKINNKTNLEIEFKTIKTSRKITHIKFIFCRTDLHPLDEINNKKNDLKAQLTDLGFKQERHKSLLKIPVEVLIPAINATKKTIEEKRIIKTIEACFYYQIGNLTDKNGKKFTNLELVFF
jgi:plasmid replication initiation protein